MSYICGRCVVLFLVGFSFAASLLFGLHLAYYTHSFLSFTYFSTPNMELLGIENILHNIGCHFNISVIVWISFVKLPHAADKALKFKLAVLSKADGVLLLLAGSVLNVSTSKEDNTSMTAAATESAKMKFKLWTSWVIKWMGMGVSAENSLWSHFLRDPGLLWSCCVVAFLHFAWISPDYGWTILLTYTNRCF